MSALRRLGTKIARLFGSRDPSAKWRRDPNLEIVLDLDTGTFCGVAFGEPIERLSGLGKCEQYSEMICVCCCEGDACDVSSSDESLSRSLGFESQGFSVSCDEDYVFESLMIFAMPLERGIKPFRRPIRLNGQTITLPDASNEDDIQRLFGEPHEVVEAYDPPEDENPLPRDMKEFMHLRPKSYDYRFDGIVFTCSFSKNDDVTYIAAYKAPEEIA